MSDNIQETIVKNLDIVEIVSEYINLHKKGKNFWGVCPFHNDSSPSMSVSREKQFFKCFACGAGGNVINFVSDYEKISYSKAIQKLASKIGIEYKNNNEPIYTNDQQKIINALKDAKVFFEYSLNLPENQHVKDFASYRGLDDETIKKFGIGYAPKNGLKDFLVNKGHDLSTLINASLVTQNESTFFSDRLIFTIENENGDPIAFSGRSLYQDAKTSKYINSIDSIVFHKNDVLYNLSSAKDIIEKDRKVYICEGFMDVIALVKIGIRNVVGLMGTALSFNHLKKIRSSKIILNLDSDIAGVNASMKSIKLLLENGFEVSVIENEQGKDADEILNKHGKDELLKIIKNQISGIHYVYKNLIANVNKNNPLEIEEFMKKISLFLKYARPIELDFIFSRLKEEFNISKETILSFLPKSEVTYSLPKKNDLKQKNNLFTYTLIKSMLKNPDLVERFKELNVNFIDLILTKICSYLTQLHDGQNPILMPDVKEEISKIISSNCEVVEDETQFDWLVSKINKQSIRHWIGVYKVKLERADNQENKTFYLKKIQELKKEVKK